MSSSHPDDLQGDGSAAPAAPREPEPGTEPTVPLHRHEHEGAYAPEREGAYAPEHEETADRRQLSVGHLVTGLVFLGISGLWLAQETGVVDVADLDLLVPVLLIVVGAAGLLAGLLRAARR